MYVDSVAFRAFCDTVAVGSVVASRIAAIRAMVPSDPGCMYWQGTLGYIMSATRRRTKCDPYGV